MTNIPVLSTNLTRWVVTAGYVLCWAIGLLVGGPTLTAGASSIDIEAAFAGSTSALIFAVLVHGAAAIFLIALGWTLPRTAASRLARGLACVAGALSFVQLCGEAAMILAPGSLDAGVVWEGITRVDGIKMFVLAGLVGAVVRGHARVRRLFLIFSLVTTLALVISGAGYVLFSPEWMNVASVSLPLLLIWVLAATVVRTTEPLD